MKLRDRIKAALDATQTKQPQEADAPPPAPTKDLTATATTIRERDRVQFEFDGVLLTGVVTRIIRSLGTTAVFYVVCTDDGGSLIVSLAEMRERL